eukprot:TRINITY_DN67028_c6_g1_i1.p1 TRINITY_DN67028_c6_g1~~TRINITY_DN67028_c6_g1_i1.p1  ORF type:complete len:111 (+),score=11.21 TRINITY_DN67028_c6_g1_i1:42-374(+)
MPFTKEILREGTGKKPPPGKMVMIHVLGTYDGKVFWNTKEFQPMQEGSYQFIPGRDNVTLKGLDEVLNMNVGEKAKFTFSGEHSYADGFPPSVPAKAEITMEIELTEIWG